ncbi:hypothetical protein APP86_14135 [Salmonella enterica subsp. houtenae]|nr:Integrase catalytic subunit [Salmonella enterica subsp. houtenae serovar 50:g,z51:- str. 01-0133]OIU97375.1 hypothetical protein APP86_14135 [Salmonella enterica subsp. houtenae]
MKLAGIKAQIGYRSPRARKGEASLVILNNGKKHAAIFLITSKCFITVSVGMVRVIRCHRLNMKINIINGSEASGLSVAIQESLLWMSDSVKSLPG